MPRLFTFSDLITRCKSRADQENQSTISDTVWKQYVSAVYGELFQTVSESGLRYFETKSTISTTGAASYTEPVDMLASIGVDKVYSDGTRRELTELMAQERNVFAGRTGEAFAFTVVDDQLFLYPKPATGETYEWIYIPQSPDMAGFADGQAVDVVTADGEQFLLWGVALMAHAKLENDVSVAIARTERDAAKQRLLEWATMRAFQNPRRRIVARDPYGEPMDPADYWGR